MIFRCCVQQNIELDQLFVFIHTKVKKYFQLLLNGLRWMDYPSNNTKIVRFKTNRRLRW